MATEEESPGARDEARRELLAGWLKRVFQAVEGEDAWPVLVVAVMPGPGDRFQTWTMPASVVPLEMAEDAARHALRVCGEARAAGLAVPPPARPHRKGPRPGGRNVH
jgi:hypothetical protein